MFRLDLSSGLAGGLLALAMIDPAAAADAPGCTDPVSLKRFAGSSLVECETRDFASYTLATGRLLSWDYAARTPVLESRMDVEGSLAQRVYFVPKGPSSDEVARSYEIDLAGNGYRVLYRAKGAELGFDQGRFFESTGPGEQLFGYSPERSRYLSLVKEDAGRRTFVSLYVIEYQGGVHSRLKGEPGQVMVRLDTVIEGGLEARMELVTAAEMDRSIEESGRVTLYGIHFDFNKSVIKPESKPALDEIARYLAANPARRLHVVGHTDGVGGFDFNVRLSEARAKAVVSRLVSAYGIAADRLKGNGVGLLAPIATNATEEGRAKNRRVELVPM
jgi:outer membrane protein OmpA-like peptidoglycan-associated protein